MATIGLSKPYYAIYENEGSTITYREGGLLGKAVELSMELDGGDTNILYADNSPAESDNTFGGGTITITTDDLLPEPMSAVLGLVMQEITMEGMSTTGPQEIVFDEGQSVPYVGFGAIAKKKQGGKTRYMAVVWPKVQFSNPGLSATTQGDTIEWQTPQISASILRDDSERHAWNRQALFETEADAEAYIKALLNIGTEAG